MKKILLSLILGASVCVSPLYAEEPTEAAAKTEEASSLWDSLRNKIESLTPKKKLVSTTAVGGVRGAQIESDDLYWKGESVAQEVNLDELTDFKNALTLYDAGNSEGAKNAFGKFVKDYPQSSLLVDANQALELLKSTQ